MKPATLGVLALAMLAAGVAGGLYYAWMIDPVDRYQTSPDALHAEDKLGYLTLIGDLYGCQQDRTQTEARLQVLGIPADGATLARLIEEHLDSGGRPEEVRPLAQLARDLGASGGVLLVFGALPTSTPWSVASPVAVAPTAARPAPSSTPFVPPTPMPRFEIVEQTALCAAPGQSGQIIVWVQDDQGHPMPGVEIVVFWPAGQDRFFTGLRPEIGAGYADFEMSPDTEYAVSLASLPGDTAEKLTPVLPPSTCPTDTLALDWRVVFQRQP